MLTFGHIYPKRTAKKSKDKKSEDKKSKDKIFQDKVGYLDLNDKTPISNNSIYRIWSMTKPIIAIAMMQLVEEKLINLNDPINNFISEFSNLKVLKNFTSSINELVDLKCMPILI